MHDRVFKTKKNVADRPCAQTGCYARRQFIRNRPVTTVAGNFWNFPPLPRCFQPPSCDSAMTDHGVRSCRKRVSFLCRAQTAIVQTTRELFCRHCAVLPSRRVSECAYVFFFFFCLYPAAYPRTHKRTFTSRPLPSAVDQTIVIFLYLSPYVLIIIIVRLSSIRANVFINRFRKAHCRTPCA